MHRQKLCNKFLAFVIVLAKIAQSILIHTITHRYYAIRDNPLLTFKGISLKLKEKEEMK